MFSLEISYHVRRFSREKFRLVEKRLYTLLRVGARNFPMGADSSYKGAKYSIQGAINAKTLRKIVIHLPTKGG